MKRRAETECEPNNLEVFKHELLARTLRALQVLSEHGYQTARTMQLAIEVLSELVAHAHLPLNCTHDELCINLILSRRLEKLKDAKENRPRRDPDANPTFFLLQRANEDCERLLSKLRVGTISELMESTTFNRELGQVAMSVIAAEYLDFGKI